MKKSLAKLLSLILAVCMLFSLSVFAASEEASGEASAETGGASGGMAADQQYGLTNDTNSVIVIKNDDVSENEEAGAYELADGGIISSDAISGISLTSSGDSNNGVYIAKDDPEEAFLFGGEEDFYEVEGRGSFNSVLELQAPAEDSDVECWYGVGVTSLGGVLTLDNVYIHTTGYRASAVYTPSGDSETTLVVKDSVLWADGAEGGFMPDFKLMVGSARATLLLGEDIWFYNSDLVARDWGAISHDTNTTDIQMYAVNCDCETYNGGYVLYALNGTQNYMYGSRLVSPQYGMFIMGQGEAVLDSLDEADEAAMSYAGDEDFSETVTEDGRTLLVGGCNAVVFHVNGNVMDPGILTIGNATVSTMPEDVVSDFGNELFFDLDSYLLSPVKFGESWFYMENCLGSLFVTRSHGGIINIEEGAELKAANGVIVQTLVGYDSDAGSIYHDSTDTRVLEDVTVNINTAVSGDILHQDYQRNMNLNISADYTGLVTDGNIVAWNNLWSEDGLQKLLTAGNMEDKFELSEEAIANIRSCLVREEDTEAYKDQFGIYMTIADGASWNVEGESSVLNLKVEKGASVLAEEYYVDCAYGADGYLDKNTGTKVDSLTEGTYENVVLVGGESNEITASLNTVEKDGILYVLLQDIMDLISGKEETSAEDDAAEAIYGYQGEFDEASASSDAVNLSSDEMELDGEQLFVWEGSAIQNSGSSTIVARNSYIRGDTTSQTGPLEGNPGNLLVGGNIRTTLALGQGQSFYINSTIVSRNWAALSTDGAEPALEENEKELSLYAYGTEAITQDGGYGAYSDLFCNLYSFGSHIQAAEIGIISGTYGAVTIGTIADGEANEEMASKLTEEDKAAQSNKEQGSIIEGGRNAIMIHSVNLPPYWEYEGYSQEESPLHSTQIMVNNSLLKTDLSLDLNIAYDAQKQAYINHTTGSVILVKSTNVDMTLNNSEILADSNGTGYLIQSVYNNDTMFMNAVPDGEEYPGMYFYINGSKLEGDVAHEDYQRKMTLVLSDSELIGALNEYDCAHWNEVSAAEGFTDYCLDSSYNTHHGLFLELKDGSNWVVTAESHMTGLSIGENCSVEGILTVDGVQVEAVAGEYTGDIVVMPA